MILSKHQNHLQDLLKTLHAEPTLKVSDLAGLVLDMRMCISNKFSSDTDVAGPEIILEGPQVYNVDQYHILPLLLVLQHIYPVFVASVTKW